MRNHEIFAVTDVTPTEIVSMFQADPLLEDGKIIGEPPQERQSKKDKANTPLCGLVRDGDAVNLRTELSDDDFWNHLLETVNADEPRIADHVATVTGFMTNYVRTIAKEDVPGRAVLVQRFIQYIVTACCQKMSSRIAHWASIGMIRNLSSVLPEEVSALFSEFEGDSMEKAKGYYHSKRNDKMLSAQLISLNEHHLTIISEQHPEHSHRYCTIQSLISL